MKFENCAVGQHVIHIPTGRVGEIDAVVAYEECDDVIVRFLGRHHVEKLSASTLEIIGSPEAVEAVAKKYDELHKHECVDCEPADEPQKPTVGKVSNTLDGLLQGFMGLAGQSAASLLGAGMISELIAVRRSLSRLADVGELIAVLQAQQCVPDHVAAQLDPWRNALLESMAKRAKRRLKQAQAVTKGKKKPYSSPTVTKQKLAAEGPCYTP